jgi:cytochrome c peroxidase
MIARLIAALAGLAACGQIGDPADEPADGDAGDPGDYRWELPPGFDPPPVPVDNPMSEVKVELGRRLFYEPRLSGNQTQSCASCHDQSLAFTDGLDRSEGSTGELTPRSSMSIANVGYASALTWSNAEVATLEEQALVPLLGTDPVELGAGDLESEIIARLSADDDYRRLFAAAFRGGDPITIDNLGRAIAAFERTVVSGGSAYDASVAGDDGALSESARRGLELFSSDRLGCFHCHGGITLSEPDTVAAGVYQNTGLYDVDGQGNYPAPNTGVDSDGRFKIPGLRNVALTAPYMHDGSVATLDEVIDHYADGGRNLTAGPNAGDGRANPYKSPLIMGFGLTAGERADLIAFLESLTDPDLVANPAFASPF